MLLILRSINASNLFRTFATLDGVAAGTAMTNSKLMFTDTQRIQMGKLRTLLHLQTIDLEEVLIPIKF
jgi:hypothetical protein